MDISKLKDEELLRVRLFELPLSIEEGELASRVQRLREEIRAKGLVLEPRFYLGDEWFSPEGEAAIAIPFYLAHPRLKALEESLMLEVEGGTEESCMKLLRHEAGHCFDHAYRFSKTKKWKRLFGSPSQEYDPDFYHPRPYSRHFVRHLENYYAQAHPDEDFAETFAVWLNPNADWKKEYARWPMALKKLEYIDQIAKSVANQPHPQAKGRMPYDATQMKIQLEKYYARRRKEHAEDLPGFYDPDLREIFSGAAELKKREFGAGRFMVRNRREIVETVGRWTGAKKYTINDLVKRLTKRCEEIDLRLGKPEAKTNLEVAAYLATLVTHYLFTGKFKRTV